MIPNVMFRSQETINTKKDEEKKTFFKIEHKASLQTDKGGDQGEHVGQT